MVVMETSVTKLHATSITVVSTFVISRIENAVCVIVETDSNEVAPFENWL